jgi:hypothetical protein
MKVDAKPALYSPADLRLALQWLPKSGSQLGTQESRKTAAEFFS